MKLPLHGRSSPAEARPADGSISEDRGDSRCRNALSWIFGTLWLFACLFFGTVAFRKVLDADEYLTGVLLPLILALWIFVFFLGRFLLGWGFSILCDRIAKVSPIETALPSLPEVPLFDSFPRWAKYMLSGIEKKCHVVGIMASHRSNSS